MQWIAPRATDTANKSLEKKLWDAADEFRANSGLTAAQYSQPILGLIFLRFADARFQKVRQELEAQPASSRRTISTDDPRQYHARNVVFLPRGAWYETLLAMPEGANIGEQVNTAMRDIEAHNPQLAGTLPKTFQAFNSVLLKGLLKQFSEIPVDLEFDAFGRIYEYFLGEFARTEGSKGGEFYTPSSIVRLLVEVLEPFHGRILDPACGSGGMFVQSARFVAEHQRDPGRELAIYGVEKTDATGQLCRMNLAVHGLEGQISHGGEVNSYYDDPHDAVGKFDFVIANPPFNVNRVDKERLKDQVGPGRRFPFGLPKTDNANYLWIQLFYSSLNETGRAGFVMANSAADARSSELEIRRQLIEAGAVDAIVAVGPNMFYTVALPCTLWFLDKGKGANSPSPRMDRFEGRGPGGGVANSEPPRLDSGRGEGAGGEGSDLPAEPTRANPNQPERSRRDTVLFLDARHIYRDIDRAHRDWSSEQVSFLANVVRLYRGEEPDYTLGGEEAKEKLEEVFTPSDDIPHSTSDIHPRYRDIPGLCKAATMAEIEAQGWSLNPGRYVGVAPGEEMDDEEFREKLAALNEELEMLCAQARELEATIASNVKGLLSS